MQQEKLPNATLILVFGILSIVTCCCYGILGLIFSIVALVLASKATALYRANPENYSDYNNVNIGRILAIIGIFLNLLMLAYIIWIISYFGWETLQDPEMLQEKIQELQGA